MRVNYGAHFCMGHGHYDAECPSCVTNRAYEQERELVVAYLRKAAILNKSVPQLIQAIENAEHWA